MFKITQKYRGEYEGEEMLVSQIWENGQWHYHHEDILYQVENKQITNQACVVGNGTSRETFDLEYLREHRGGMAGSRALQIYGCNAFYRDFKPQFLVATSDAMCQELIASGYCDNNIVYTNAEFVKKYPGKFYLIPQNPPYNAGTTAAYLAAFDGHKKIYLLGFDNGAGANYNNNMYAGTNAYAPKDHNYNDEFFIQSMIQVFTAYPEVEFVRVMPSNTWWTPPSWASMPNFRQINYKDFAYEADL